MDHERHPALVAGQPTLVGGGVLVRTLVVAHHHEGRAFQQPAPGECLLELRQGPVGVVQRLQVAAGRVVARQVQPLQACGQLPRRVRGGGDQVQEPRPGHPVQLAQRLVEQVGVGQTQAQRRPAGELLLGDVALVPQVREHAVAVPERAGVPVQRHRPVALLGEQARQGRVALVVREAQHGRPRLQRVDPREHEQLAVGAAAVPRLREHLVEDHALGTPTVQRRRDLLPERRRAQHDLLQRLDLDEVEVPPREQPHQVLVLGRHPLVCGVAGEPVPDPFPLRGGELLVGVDELVVDLVQVGPQRRQADHPHARVRRLGHHLGAEREGRHHGHDHRRADPGRAAAQVAHPVDEPLATA
ncbi:hypothetical protein BJF81_06360 [Ornithinimicrobium sp. CNJ-824]|nr:hypothetical protein BJF81_06360 [Ornithinimicrobium sp. CNJ-824]